MVENDVGKTGAPQGDASSASGVPATPPPSSPPREPAPTDNPLQSDIASILKDVKLPDRLNKPEETAPRQPKTYDTTLPGDPRRTTPVADLPTATGAAMEPTIRAANVAPQTTPVAPADIQSLHTLKDDLQGVVKEKKISLVRAAALEEEKRAHLGTTLAAVVKGPRSRHTSLAVFVSTLLIGLGVLALAAVLVTMQGRSGSSPTPESSQLLFAEQGVPLPVDDQTSTDLRRTLGAARNSAVLTLGAILQIVPVMSKGDPATNRETVEPLTTSEFLTALGTRAPGELIRAISDEFFLGIHTVDESAPIIVIPVISYERAFAGMLAWERTMNDDLSPLFTPVSHQKMTPDGIAERTFEDTVMRNYDVRMLRDDTATIQLYYSFPTRNILIIAESPYSFTEVLSRLRADRRL